MNYIDSIERYVPYNEQEKKDKNLILNEIKQNKNILSRNSLNEHITVSAWVLNKEHNKVLMAYHNIYNSWAWLGGHADGESDLQKVAIKEAQEESGIKAFNVMDQNIFSLEVLTVNGHIKNGEYVSSHLHMNITYLLEADEEDNIKIKEDENSAVGWLTFDEVLNKSTETWFVNNIYPKLIAKSKAL